PTPSDVALICYTSGSTGPFKGVMITHQNLIASVAGTTLLPRGLDDTAKYSYLAYLPLSHVLEYTAEMIWIAMGVRCVHVRCMTLTDTSVKNCRGDFNEVCATHFAGVPAVSVLSRK
ncbi:AMP-dependent synthetase/ligase, partial [Chytriomyces sp. MP71]